MNFILKYRRLLRWIISLGTLAFAVGATQLGISFSFEDFYPKDDEDYDYYAEYKERFGEEQNYIVYLALKSTGDDIFHRPFLQAADSLSQRLMAIENVDSVLSATRMPQMRRAGLGISRRPYLRFDTDEAVESSRKRIARDSSLVGSFITRDYQYVCAYIFIDPEVFDSRDRDLLNDELEKIVQESGLEYVLSGIPYIRTKYVEKIGTELIIFVSLSLILIVTVLFLTYRNFWGIVIPVITVLVCLTWILGLMGITGQTVNLISNLIIPIMFVVGMSDVIHLTTRYLHEVKAGKRPGPAMRDSIKEIGFAIFLTSLTTAIGFASLLVSRVPPIRDFGLYAAAGVIFAYAITVVILPYALLLIKPEAFTKVPSLENQPFWKTILGGFYRFTLEKPRQIVQGSILVLGLCIYLIFQIPLNTYLIEDIGANDPVRISMEFFEERSYGMRPFEVGLHAKNGARISDQTVLVQIEKIQNFLSAQSDFSPFLSPATVVAEANYLDHFNQERYRKVPDEQEAIDDLLAFLELNGGGDILYSMMTKDGLHARISGRGPDIGTDSIESIFRALDDFMAAEVDTSLISYRPTGHAYLTERNLQYVRSSLMWGLTIAFIVIGILMGLLFRSWKMMLISMFPNVIPLILTGGVMGLFGITLTASISIIFAISFGIAVDDTIHFLTRYRMERRQGKSVEESIQTTIVETGKAMMLTSFILVGGFVILLASDFGGTYGVGLFTGLTVLFALLSDFLLLPILLRWVEKKGI
jgi:predicted RND superfamily exporter protein